MLSLANVLFIILKKHSQTTAYAWLRKSVSAHHVRMVAHLNLVDKRLRKPSVDLTDSISHIWHKRHKLSNLYICWVCCLHSRFSSHCERTRNQSGIRRMKGNSIGQRGLSSLLFAIKLAKSGIIDVILPDQPFFNSIHQSYVGRKVLISLLDSRYVRYLCSSLENRNPWDSKKAGSQSRYKLNI